MIWSAGGVLSFKVNVSLLNKPEISDLIASYIYLDILGKSIEIKALLVSGKWDDQPVDSSGWQIKIPLGPCWMYLLLLLLPFSLISYFLEL